MHDERAEKYIVLYRKACKLLLLNMLKPEYSQAYMIMKNPKAEREREV